MGDDDNADNGLFFNSFFIPREILALIFSFIPPDPLVRKCKFVCKNWRDVINKDDVWKIKIQRSNLKSFSHLSSVERSRLKLPWNVFYQICLKDPLEKNLLFNNCGKNRLNHWSVEKHSATWLVESIPVGSDLLPASEDFKNETSCFATTYSLCSKKQIIDLHKNGISGYLMNELQPKIIISEWFAGRFDCGCVYTLTASLLNEKKNVLVEKKESRRVEQWQGRSWEKVTIPFQDYGPGVKYIVFHHSGKDTQYWAGHYGSKMSGGVVKITMENRSN